MMPWKVEYAAQSSVKVSAVPCRYYCPGLTYNVRPATKVANFSGVALLTPAQVGIYFVYRIWSVRCVRWWFVKQASYHCCKYLYPDSYWRHSEDTYKEFPQQPEGSTWYPQTKVSNQSPILSKGFRFRALLSPFLHFSVCGWLDCSEWSNNNFTSNAIWFRVSLLTSCEQPDAIPKVILGLMYYLAIAIIAHRLPH